MSESTTPAEVQEQRKALRRSRIKKYFIAAAKEIVDEEGISALTIRRVSDMAGYNSATLYNYFDDLNHLAFLSCMESLKQYNKALIKRLKGISDPIKFYMSAVDCFSEFSCRSPDVFWLLFYGSPEDKRESYVKEYYELYPSEEDETLPMFNQAKLTHNINKRNLIFLSGCIDSGCITLENARLFDGVSSMVTRCILEDLTNGKMTSQQAAGRNHSYYLHLLKSYLKPEFQHLLDD